MYEEEKQQRMNLEKIINQSEKKEVGMQNNLVDTLITQITEQMAQLLKEREKEIKNFS